MLYRKLKDADLVPELIHIENQFLEVLLIASYSRCIHRVAVALFPGIFELELHSSGILPLGSQLFLNSQRLTSDSIDLLSIFVFSSRMLVLKLALGLQNTVILMGKSIPFDLGQSIVCLDDLLLLVQRQLDTVNFAHQVLDLYISFL